MKEFVENQRNIHSLQLAGLTAISLLILQAMISIGTPDIGATISLIALALAIPALVFSTLNTLIVGTSAHITWLYIFLRAIGMTGAVVGIEAALWRLSWIAGAGFLLSGAIGMACHLRFQSYLRKILSERGGQEARATFIPWEQDT